MTLNNSIKPVNYLLYLILLFSYGCAEKNSKHVIINEIPPATDSVAITTPITPSVPENQKTSVTVKATLRNSAKTQTKITQPWTVWDRLFSLYSLPYVDNRRIDKEVQNYLRHPKYIAKIQRRAEPYLYFILNEIEAKQLPGELALLPVVESAFNPNAVSRSRASGLWQFMPATGRVFGLKQNWWYDGRNDVYTSTQAATTYLKQLANLYDNDWFLALAAYNAGKGNIRKFTRRNIKHNRPTDYWSLRMSRETMNYVPRLLAIAKILANADQYNIPLKPIPNKPFFDVINVGSQVDLGIAAKAAQMPIKKFIRLNPAFKRWSTDPNGPFHLLIHSDKAELFKEKIALLPKKQRMKWVRHKIKEGDNLGFIAAKHGTTVKAIQQSNRLSGHRIRTGKYLLIPGSSYRPQHKTKSSTHRLYTVKKGDTFWDIARLFSVRSRDIANWNNISLKKILRPGQKLIIKKS